MPLVRVIARIVLAALVLGSGPSLDAQEDPDHRLYISDAVAEEATVTLANYYVNFSESTAISGWHWGNCLGDAAIADVVLVEDGEDTLALNDGAGPDFEVVELFPGLGWTVDVVIDFSGVEVLPPAFVFYQLHLATYDVFQSGPCFVAHCDNLGTPPVITAVVDENGKLITPTITNGTIMSVVDGPQFRYHAPSAMLVYDAVNGVGSVDVSVAISEKQPYMAMPTAGFAMGLAHDPDLVAVVPGSIVPAQELIDAFGDLPDFFATNVQPGGWTLGVVYSFYSYTLAFPPEPDALAVADLTYETVAAGMAGDGDVGAVVALEWSDDLGMPPVANTIVVFGDALDIEGVPGLLELVPAPPFIRGDCNDTGSVDIADGIYILRDLFLGGPSGGCFGACDANDDGVLSQLDAMAVFQYQLLGGPPPPAPFPDCGIVAGGDCGVAAACSP